MPDISVLTNNAYRVLDYMYNKKDKNNFVVVTQNEVCQDLDLSKGTVNTIFKTLRDKGYITQDEEHVGRYALTDSGVKTVSLFRKSERG